MMRVQKLITKRHIKKKNLMLDVLFFIVFEKQNSIKFIQRKNYKNTSFVHTNFIQNYNWAFWKKHTPFNVTPIDIIGYNNIINPIFTTQQFICNQTILIYNLFSLNFNKNILLIQSKESKFISTANLLPGFSFYEREVSELFGINFSKKKDNRNLLLDYGNFTKPMLRGYSQYGKYELRYTKFFDGPKIIKGSLNSI